MNFKTCKCRENLVVKESENYTGLGNNHYNAYMNDYCPLKDYKKISLGSSFIEGSKIN